MRDLNAHDATSTVIAGGVAALGAQLPEDVRTSPVTARTYAHPALDGKVIVRLEPDAVAAGTDAEMAAFGFDAPTVSPALGQVRYRTLGFPAWALVHQPKHAKAALAVTEDMRKAKRLVASKPGHAKDAFEKIAKTLSRGTPQFLPSFWEEVGRVIADQASATMAAQCFERARQAERAYKLKGNPDDQDAAFVEFALLGALSAKTLSAYAKELVKAAGGKEAHRRFRAIVVKRALGGMPPYAGMGKDVRALAEAAGIAVEADEDALVAELLEAPGVGKAPGEFWATHRAAIVRLGTAQPALRTRLRTLWPEPRGGTREQEGARNDAWVALLDEVGALADLPDDGLGAWVSKLMRYAGFTPRTEAVLRALAPRLVALEQPIAVVTPTGRWGDDLHLALAELALELGVTLADPRDRDDFFTSSVTVDPVRVANEPRYAKKLIEVMVSMMGDADHEHRMVGRAGFAAAREQWLGEQIAALEGGLLIAVDARLDTLEGKTSAETFVPYPALHARLAATDLAPSLARQLRAGIADEFGWPAYEAAFAALGGEIQFGGVFPVLTAWNASKAIAVDHTGVLAEHDLVVKAKEYKVEQVYFLDGQFLVELDPVKGWKHLAYWSSAPKQVFEMGVRYKRWGGDIATAWAPPSGGVSLGGKAFRAGDTQLGAPATFATDGTTMWIHGDNRWRVVDPVTGKPVGDGAPPFVAEPQTDGWKADGANSVLLPAPAGLTWSPLGVKDGLLAQRGATKETPLGDGDTDERHRIERLDGVRWEGGQSRFALVVFPGDDAPRPIDTISADHERFPGGDGPGVLLLTADEQQLAQLNEHTWASRGWGAVYVPPAAFWDYLAVRDEAGSVALRGITDDAARAILAAARGEVEAGGESEKRALTATEAAVRAALPAITDGKLVAGVAGIAERAAEISVRLATLAAERDKANADASGTPLVGDAAQVRKLAAALAARRPQTLKDIDVSIDDWLADARLRAQLAYLPLASESDRREARAMMRALAGTVFAEPGGRVRVIQTTDPDNWDNYRDDVLIKQIGESWFAIHVSNNWAIEVSDDGQWRVPEPFKIDKAVEVRGVGEAWAAGYAALPEAPPAWEPAWTESVAARADLSPNEAALLAVGLFERDSWRRPFLDAKQCAQIGGMKPKDAEVARTTFRELDDDVVKAMLAQAVPDDVALLATPLAPGSWIERVADAWKAKFGKRVKVPQDLVAAAKKDLRSLGSNLGSYLAAFGGELDAWFLRPDLRPLEDLGGWNDKEGATPGTVEQVLRMASWLFVARPVGDAVRAGIAGVGDALTKLIDDPRTVWSFDALYTGDPADADNAKKVARAEAVFDLVGGREFEQPKDPDDDDAQPSPGRDDGAFIAVRGPRRLQVWVRPAKLDAAALAKAQKLMALCLDPDDKDATAQSDALDAVRRLRAPGFASMVARVRETPVAAGSYEVNPLQSAPKLVAKVAKAEGLSEAAAALYLQMLALPEPTQRNVQLWNAWTPKVYAAAAAELVKAKLVIEGKRERAGRSIFLRGGYTKGDAINLPTEEWKLAFYTTGDRLLPGEPPHELFARAYKRVEGGEKP